mmetsp:Transcript_118746/g.369977  ORF Transcript_118746/g.369977 Transcript_118746/m.369977 type:complete len:247 (-) Transcript_118746:1158-1898(-)
MLLRKVSTWRPSPPSSTASSWSSRSFTCIRHLAPAETEAARTFCSSQDRSWKPVSSSRRISAASFPQGKPSSATPTKTRSVQSRSVTIAASSSPTSRTMLQVSGNFSYAFLARFCEASLGGHCSCGQDDQASKMASLRDHQHGRQHPWSMGPKPWGFSRRSSNKLPVCRSMLKIRMSSKASASAASWGTNSSARSLSRGMAKSSMKPIALSTKACTEPASSSPSTLRLAREVTGTAACEPAIRSMR